MRQCGQLSAAAGADCTPHYGGAVAAARRRVQHPPAAVARMGREIAREETVTLVVQVNGKVRAKVDVPAGIDNAEAERIALEEENIQRYLDGKQPRKVIVVPGRLVNIVV
jgi:leucyl-tRNA synthetase